MRISEGVKRVFRYTVVIGFILLFSLFIFHHDIFDTDEEEDPVSPSPSLSPSVNRNIQLELTKMISRKDKAKYWELEAETIYINEETQKGEAKKITCTFYDEKEKPSMTFVAEGADIDMANQSLYFKGTVKGTMISGEKLEVARLVWDGAKKRVFGYDSVKIVRGMSVLKGRDMVGDPQKRYVEIIGDVDVTWRDQDGEKNTN